MEVELKLSLSTACLYVYPLRWIFVIAKRAGFDGIELVISPEVELRGAEYVRRLSEEFALPIYTVHPPLFPYPGWGELTTTIAPYLQKAQRITREMGSPVMVVHMPKARQKDSGKGRVFIEEILRSRDHQNGNAPTFALENRPRFRARDSQWILTEPQDLRAFADKEDFPMTLDTTHIGSWDLNLLDSYADFRSRLVNIHLSDLHAVPAIVERAPALHSYVKQHQLPGTGTLPIRDFIRLLAREHYNGPVTFELSPTALQIWSPRAAEGKLKECVEFVRKTILDLPL